MIEYIIVTNYLGDSLKLELARPEKSGFIVQSIDGLGPPKANINMTDNATSDGSSYNSGKADKRNIVLKLLFEQYGSETIEDARQKSYKYFPIKKPVTLTIKSDNRICETAGYVESNTPDIFSKKSGCQISIVCPDPYLYSDEVMTTVFYGIEPNFEFPFENNSLSENLIEFGIITNKTENFIFYDGDSEVGITIVMHAVGDATNVTIHNTGTREKMKIDTTKLAALTGHSIINGDDIVITTNKNYKSIYLTREGITTNILNCIDRDSDWFTLSKGDNLFAYVAETGASNLQFRILNRVIYEGV